ncbi:MAG TPA: cobalamin-dependent protein [Anaerolineae bacterium]|nr:cobalamin-dependent protein [Anaerolineae bacterium]
MKVLLVNPPYPKFPDEPKHASPPLGLAYIAAVLELKQYPVKIIDCVVEGFDTETEFNGEIIYGIPITQLIHSIEEYKPDVIGISCIFSTLDSIIKELSKHIKKNFPEITIVLGGTHATVMAEQLIREPFIDYVVRGEGEHSFLNLIEHLEQKRQIETVSNLTWLDNGEIRSTPQEFIQNIDELPFPARHLLNMEGYIKIGHMQGLTKKGSRATTLITSRGCPAKCIFCSIHAVWGHKFRAHSPQYTLDEMQQLRNKYGIEHLLFEDDNLTLDKTRATTIFKGMIDRKFNFSWTAPNGIALWALNDSLLTLIRDSGCYRLSLGVESGDPVTLRKIIRKPLRFDTIEQLVKTCKRLKINTTAFFVIGLPGETIQSIKRSMRYAENLDVGSLCISIATPYPGTCLYEICKQEGYLIENFQFGNLMTHLGQIHTPEFNPKDLENIMSKTLVRHALKHPFGILRRVSEKLKASPKETFSFIIKRIISSV